MLSCGIRAPLYHCPGGCTSPCLGQGMVPAWLRPRASTRDIIAQARDLKDRPIPQ